MSTIRRTKLPRVTRSLVSDELRFFGRAMLPWAARVRRVCVASAPAALCGAVTLALPMGCAAPAAMTKEISTMPVAAASVVHEDKASPALKTFLDDRMKQELTALQLRGETSPLGYTADASVLTLARAKGGGRDKVSCTVLLTLLDSTHSPVATVRGNASAEGARDNPLLARDAVRGAAHAAVSQLPSVFQQLQNK